MSMLQEQLVVAQRQREVTKSLADTRRDLVTNSKLRLTAKIRRTLRSVRKASSDGNEPERTESRVLGTVN